MSSLCFLGPPSPTRDPHRPPTKETSQARPCFRACEARPLWVSSSETLASSPSHFIRFWFQLKFRVGPCLTVSRRICFPLAEARGVEQDRSGRHPPAQARGGGPLSARGGAAGRTWAAHVGPLGRGGGGQLQAGPQGPRLRAFLLTFTRMPTPSPLVVSGSLSSPGGHTCAVPLSPSFLSLVLSPARCVLPADLRRVIYWSTSVLHPCKQPRPVPVAWFLTDSATRHVT